MGQTIAVGFSRQGDGSLTNATFQNMTLDQMRAEHWIPVSYHPAENGAVWNVILEKDYQTSQGNA